MSLTQSLNLEYLKRVEKTLYMKYEAGIIQSQYELQDKIDQAYDAIMKEPFK